MSPAVAVVLIALHAPGGARVDLNPAEIVVMRDAQKPGLLEGGAHCVIATVDGKFISVVETCETVRGLVSRDGERRGD